jgi:predicted dehydrogenase
VVAAVPFVYRFYPTVREARARIGAGDAGPLWLLHGSYLQDWLAGSDAANWRVDPKLGGTSRAFGDIGVHWCDLMEFTTGHRITRLAARMARAYPDRITEDGAALLFDTDRGASGSVVVSQVSPGRKNRLWFSFDGPSASYVFDQELPDSLWVGGQRANQVVVRGPDTLSEPAASYARLPAGHPHGYQDSFNAFVADVYAAIGGQKPDGLPAFADGLRAAVLTEAVVESAANSTWVEVPT